MSRHPIILSIPPITESASSAQHLPRPESLRATKCTFFLGHVVLRRQQRCLNAFIVALSQARDGGEKAWYTSTLELQLASIEFCRDCCRSGAALHLRVMKGTPRSLGTPPKARTGHSVTQSEGRRSSCVPVVRALRLTSCLPIEDLL